MALVRWPSTLRSCLAVGPGWSTPTRAVRRYADLPDNARRYIARLEEVSGVRAAIISTGSERNDTIIRDDVLTLLNG